MIIILDVLMSLMIDIDVFFFLIQVVWKEAVQTKLKRKRNDYQDNIEVQHNRSKFSRFGSGRPVKRKLDEIATRDKQKQVIFLKFFYCFSPFFRYCWLCFMMKSQMTLNDKLYI